ALGPTPGGGAKKHVLINRRRHLAIKRRRKPRAGSRLEPRRGGPFRKQHVCLLRADTLRRQLPRCKRARYLIDQCFGGKSNALTLLLRIRIIHLADFCPPDRRDAKQARLAGGVDLTTAQIGRAKPLAGIANGDDFAVCGRIIERLLLTTALADDRALLDND